MKKLYKAKFNLYKKLNSNLVVNYPIDNTYQLYVEKGDLFYLEKLQDGHRQKYKLSTLDKGYIAICVSEGKENLFLIGASKLGLGEFLDIEQEFYPLLTKAALSKLIKWTSSKFNSYKKSEVVDMILFMQDGESHIFYSGSYSERGWGGGTSAYSVKRKGNLVYIKDDIARKMIGIFRVE